MEIRRAKTIPNICALPASKPRFFALLVVFCILTNSFYPRALIELKNYDVVVLAMGSQSVFLHLFDLPEKVAIELASLLFDDDTQTLGEEATGNNHKPKAATNSASDYSIMVLEQRVQKVLELGAGSAGVVGAWFGGMHQAAMLEYFGLFAVYGMTYFMFLMLFYSRPRGDTASAAINPIKYTINNEPGLNCKPGFLFIAEARLISEVLS